ncbi:hypothetical protein N0V88_005233 [Collariella sp. IMI 366227]|nr:hypothetical protein N0V88_005233 [Collariella sp. IMI 366227]
MSSNIESEPSAASRLLEQHMSHHVTVEDAADEDLPSTSAAAAEATPSNAKPSVDTPATKAPEKKSAKLGGGAPKPSANIAPTWGARPGGNGADKASAPASGATTPTPPALRGPKNLSIPGRNVEYMLLEAQHVLPRNQLKKPITDIVKDFNRKSRAQVKVLSQPDGKVRIEATGPQDIATQALKDFVRLIGTKLSIKVPIPRSARAHIIGRQGSTIKAIQEQTGARIQMPKIEEGTAPVDEDDDETIDVIIEGNSQEAAAARNAVLKIAGERAANVNARVKDIPAEFYPFIAGPQNQFLNRFEQDKVQVRVPQYQPWSSQAPVAPGPGQRPQFQPAAESSIQLAGDRDAVRAAREAIERHVQQLHQELMMEQLPIQRGRHQFIIGARGVPMDRFFEDTGCVLILPNDDDEDMVTVIGPSEQVQNGVEKAMDLAMNMQCSNIDISRFHRQAPGGAAVHARNVTRYLRQRGELERLEKLHNVHFNTPYSEEGAAPWELYSRDGKNAIRAQSEIKGLVDAHPPARVATVTVDPFFHPHIRADMASQVRQNYGVYLVVPEASDANAPVVLVYENPEVTDSYQIPRTQPSQAEIAEMQRRLQEAQRHILRLVDQQEQVTAQTVDIPQKYHEKLRKFIKAENDNRPAGQFPLRVSNTRETVKLRGPASAVESLAAKCLEFVEQQKQEDKERGFTLEFDFPQKFANHLIGKGGSNIRELRDKFDVDIQVNDGKVLLKGPKAKAEAAKTHILALGRQMQDEATHILKIDPKFHRELIGAQGSQINKLQERYNVLIFFPRSGKKQEDESDSAPSSEAGKPLRQPDEVTIRGPKRGADEARDELLNLLQYLKDTSFTATVTVQRKQVPSLIGSGGAAMEQLRQATGAKIDVPSAKESADSEVQILIKGTKTQVAEAKKVLEQKKAVFDDTVVKTIEVPRKYHKTLIGTGGANLRKIVLQAGGSDDRRELARTIQFPKQDSDGNNIKIEGRTAVVDNILSQIQAIVDERESQVTISLDIPVEHHKAIIGRGGDAKRALEAQFKVSIDVPRQGSEQTALKIAGQPEDVEKAKAHLLDMVKDNEGETVPVPRAMHHAVANNGQIFRRLKNDFGVTVTHAHHQVPPKPEATSTSRTTNNGALPLITDESPKTSIPGPSSPDPTPPPPTRTPPSRVEKAKKAIATALEQAKKEDTVGYLVLPDPRTYRFVIGQGGSKVNAIRKQSGCKITVPRDQSQGTRLRLWGAGRGGEGEGGDFGAVKDGGKGKEKGSAS